MRKITYFLSLTFLLSTRLLLGQSVKLGVVTDFPQNAFIDSVFQTIATEIDRTTDVSKKVTLSTSDIRYNTQDLRQARTNYDQVGAQVDMVILVGSISVKGAAEGILYKPTIGLGVIDPELEGIPFKNGKSGVENFTYIWPTQNFEEELMQFRQLIPFNNLTVLVDATSAVTFNQEKSLAALDSIGRLLSANINIVPISGDIAGSLGAIPSQTDAVYLTVLYGKSPDELKQIVTHLNEQKLPSFSGSKRHVEMGVLGCITDENDLQQAVRRLSIMADEALEGGSLASMPVAINYKREFYLNLQTAEDINFSPPFGILFTANIIDKTDEGLPVYSLNQVMERALEASLDVKLSYKDIELSVQDLKSAKTAVLPTLDLSVTGAQINSERANALVGSSERSLSGDLTLTQLIYSEDAIAGIKISEYLNKAQEYDTEADVLNVLLDTYIGYFNVLSAKTNVSIRQENLNNTETNLELAKIRVDFGSASNADIYRWESEVANAKQALVEAETGLLTSKFQLNTFLANTLEKEFDIQDVTINDQVYQQFLDGPIAKFVKTPDDLKFATQFLIKEALTINPNKKFLLENIKLTEREKLQNRRLLYTPRLSLQAQRSQILGRGGKGSVEVPGAEFMDNSWQVGVSLAYPLFKGNGRRINIQRSIVQLEQLNYSRQSLDQSLELAVKTNTLQVLSSSTNIAFSKIASDNSLLNFNLVQDNYKQGSVSITQLIDAQQAALQAKLNYVLSVYDYMVAQLQLEFSIGFFSMVTSPENLQDFEDRFNQFRTDN